MSNASNITTTTAGSIPENARGPAIPQDIGYLVQDFRKQSISFDQWSI
jgi:hypothetical protein